jgi:salicylate hydroxylase
VDFRLGTRIEGINFDKTSIQTRDGAEFHADFIVGADGLKSVCRELLVGRPDPPRVSGTMAYRIQIDVKEMMQHPELVEFVSESNFDEWMGPHAHAVGYLLKNEGPYNIVLFPPDDLPESVLIAKGDVQEMRDFFKDWDPRLRTMISYVQEVFKWRLLDLNDMKTWSHPSGSFILIGDACHAMMPNLGQGAATAVEDGAVLGNVRYCFCILCFC